MSRSSDNFRRNIYAHRGLWASEAEKNSIKAIELALKEGFAVETDLRSYNSKIVISHDSPDENSPHFFDIADWETGRFALNIKEDGLFTKFEDYRDCLVNSESFFFDGSFPDMYHFARRKLPFALRRSDLELEIAMKSEYVWLDSFNSDWWDETDILKLIQDGYKVVVVSPELHGRDPQEIWRTFKNLLLDGVNVGICTDFPRELLGQLANV